VSGVAGEIEEHRHRLLAEDGGVGGGHLESRGGLAQPVIEHEGEFYLLGDTPNPGVVTR